MEAHLVDLRAEAPPEKVEILASFDPVPALDPAQCALLEYARKITLSPAKCCEEDIEALRVAGAKDVEIHAAVQVASYFNYVNRVADALGVEPERD